MDWSDKNKNCEGCVSLSNCSCAFCGTHLLFLDGKGSLDFIQTLDWIILNLPLNNNIIVVELFVVSGVKFYFERK